jgi:hypothetical protein
MRVSLLVLTLLGALGIGGFILLALTDDDASGGATAPVLPDTQILLGGEDPQLGEGIFGMDAETGSLRLIIRDPTSGLPTVSEDRRWMVYLTALSKAPDGPPGGVPRLARVDGSDDGRLLDVEATKKCPFTMRPAFSQDGRLLATICLDVNRQPVGLGIVDRDGHLVRLLRRHDLSGGPTWTGDGRIVVMRDPEGDDTTTLWVISADGEKQQPVTNGVDGSDSHPDWSDHGLLFLRDRGESKDVLYLETLEARGARPITVSGKAASPAWGPGDQPTVVWLEPATGGNARSLRVTTLGDAPPTPLNTGTYGPPAWGSR